MMKPLLSSKCLGYAQKQLEGKKQLEINKAPKATAVTEGQ